MIEYPKSQRSRNCENPKCLVAIKKGEVYCRVPVQGNPKGKGLCPACALAELGSTAADLRTRFPNAKKEQIRRLREAAKAVQQKEDDKGVNVFQEDL